MKVIAGTGRCGTRWIASILRVGGITVGHEYAHTPDMVRDMPGLQVDVSWLALTHQIVPDVLVGREPAGCIGSLIDCGLFVDGDRYTAAVGRCLELTGDPYVDACRWWVWANTRPAKARWRLDRPDLLAQTLSSVGIFVDNLTLLPSDRHPIGTRVTTIATSELPDDVCDVAKDWGWM